VRFCPQGLKPQLFPERIGTAKAVPFLKPKEQMLGRLDDAVPFLKPKSDAMVLVLSQFPGGCTHPYQNALHITKQITSVRHI
jgi:hypothetical protein